MDKPRIGYAARGTEAHLHAPVRYLPIIVVPDMMGSRLTDPRTGNLAWNPLGLPLGKGPKVFAVDYLRLQQTSAELVPDETHGFADDDPDYPKALNIKHLANLMPDLYGDLAKGLAGLELGTGFMPGCPLKPRVYCCGYDFRLDNARSALRLAAVVDEALRETRERKVVIIAHGMGGLVARYYSRILGGESRIFRMFLIGSPTLGAPSAFTQLKQGPPGFYLKDLLDDTSAKDKVSEGIQMAGSASAAIGGALGSGAGAGTRIGKATKGFFGELFSVLCLGSGRYLMRKETTAFVRQMPSVYQLLPGALYCRNHVNWAIFDPLATGIPPTGYVILLPTLLDAAEALAGGAMNALSSGKQKLGDTFKSDLDSFLKPDDAERTSPLATRNCETLVHRLVTIGNLITNKVPPTPPGQQPDPTYSTSGFTNFTTGVTKVGEMVSRIQRCIMDCTSNKSLYSDIFTGLLDFVELRPMCAANLALAYRFDDSLIVNPCPIAAQTPLGLLMSTVIKPALGLLAPSLPDFAHKGIDGMLAGDQKDAAKRAKATAYVHPATINVYGTTEPVEAGCLLLPTDVLSNNDSNLVQWMLVPGTLMEAFALLMPGAGAATGLASQALGDGTVPIASANPAPEVLSNPLLDAHAVPLVDHEGLPGSDDVRLYLKTQFEGFALDFLAT